MRKDIQRLTFTKLGFSLVELSIVLVILGLLVGGVLSGQSLIRAAELRAVSTEYQRLSAASYAFRDKYFALPGDMANATSFWGVAHATPATCKTTSSTSALTCDGDGNGQVGSSAGSDERFRYWQHLANAGLLEGSYTGVTGAGGTWDSVVGNSPPTRFSQGSWAIQAYNGISGGWYFTIPGLANYMLFGKNGGTSNLSSALKPEEIWNVDTKVDDGKPGTGNLIAYPYIANCTNAASATDYAATYLLTISTPTCAFLVKTGL